MVKLGTGTLPTVENSSKWAVTNHKLVLLTGSHLELVHNHFYLYIEIKVDLHYWAQHLLKSCTGGNRALLDASLANPGGQYRVLPLWCPAHSQST